MSLQFGIYTNKQWKEGSGSLFSSINPATDEVLWNGHAAGKKDIDEVIKNAKKACIVWCNLSIDERSIYLDNFSELLQQKLPYLAEIISKETGKTLWDSKTEVSAMINKVGISLEAHGRRCAGMIKNTAMGKSITRHRSHGVVAVMGPYNFPGHLPNGHIIPALLAGNAVIFKPSELTPLVGEEIMKCWDEVGLPPGVINLVQGGPETGKALVQHPDLNGLFFTGSYAVGKTLSEQFGAHPNKILALEMGGNNPFVVTDISDFETAAYLTIQSAYISTGQRCTCARRLIVPHGEKGDAFIQTLLTLAKGIAIGPYTEKPEPYIGPLIRESHVLKVIEAQKNLIDSGGIPLLKAEQLKQGKAFISPGLIDVTAIQDRPDHEIFGPFLQLIRVHDLDEAISIANQTKYGLAAGILTDNPEEYQHFYKNIEAGIINWNTQLTGASSVAPFGGIKSSGNFRPSAFYAADYCSYPVASMELPEMKKPTHFPPGLKHFESK